MAHYLAGGPGKRRPRMLRTFTPMRLVSFLFSLYFACLTCLPCADEAAAGVEPTQPTVAAAHSDYGHADRGDWCSPLCQCQCCAGAVAPPTSPTALVKAAPTAVWAPAPRFGRVVECVPNPASRGVWQPPKA